MEYLLLVSSLVSLLVSSSTSSNGNSTILTSTSHKTTSSSMILDSSSAKSSSSVISSTIVAPTTADVSSTNVHGSSTTVPMVTSSPTTSSSIPITLKPSKSSARPSTSVPHTTGKPTTGRPATTTAPKPVAFYYNSSTHSGTTCVAIEGIILLTVRTGRKSRKVYVEGAPKTTGHCKTSNVTSSSISATWDEKYKISMDFTFNKDRWFLSEIDVDFFEGLDVYANETFKSVRNDGHLQGGTYQSYTCPVEKQLFLNSNKTGSPGNITVDFKELKIQPFPSNETFPNVKSCPKGGGDSKPNSIVPIAVGCALAGLIVIVLIAYLIGRRKSNKGYQQV